MPRFSRFGAGIKTPPRFGKKVDLEREEDSTISLAISSGEHGYTLEAMAFWHADQVYYATRDPEQTIDEEAFKQWIDDEALKCAAAIDSTG